MDTPAQRSAVTGLSTGEAGLVLDERYRLEQVRAEHRVAPASRSVLWRATDLSLDRPVALTIVADAADELRAELFDAATAASTLSDTRFVRVFDVGETQLADHPVIWIAAEWVDGPSLASVVRDEPLAPPVATEVARQCAEAIAAAHESGLVHGLLHPNQVLLPTGGAPRICGLGIAAVLHDVSATALDDVRDLGGLLYAALTASWPLPGWNGLPPVDQRAAHAARPRIVQGGIPRDVDDVTHRALTGGYTDARQLARALSLLPSRPLDAPPPAPEPPRSDAVKKWSWRIVPPVLVVAVALTGWAVGSQLGRVPLLARQPHAALPPAKESGPGAGKVSLVWRSPPAVTSFDPGGDGEENPDSVSLAVDRDLSTEWTTDTYRGDPHLGGLKPGVGLLLDLGRPRSVQVAELVLSSAGADVEVRAGDTAPTQAGDLPVVAHRDNAPIQSHLTLSHTTSARYWLIWFTSLPAYHGGYRVGVAEIALLG